MLALPAPIVLHPGFVKTATKTLQLNLFAAHPDILFLGRPAPAPELDAAIKRIAYEDSTRYRAEEVAAVLQRYLERAPRRRVIVLSNENFALYEATDRGVVAERLHRLAPEARVLFTIRRQEEVLVGWYLQKLRKYFRGGHYLSFPEWLRIKFKEPHRSILADLDYSGTILRYVELFGRERVEVLPFELLKAEPHLFAARLAAWLGVEAEGVRELLARPAQNPSRTTLYIAFHRTLGRLLPARLAFKLGVRLVARLPGRRPELRLDPATRSWLRAHCAAGNRRLAEIFDLDLGRFGYVLAESHECGEG